MVILRTPDTGISADMYLAYHLQLHKTVSTCHNEVEVDRLEGAGCCCCLGVGGANIIRGGGEYSLILVVHLEF